MPVLPAGIIDVFATKPLEGNPLAIVEDSDDLSDETMRRISGEFNQAETTFVMRSDRADRRLRSFTASGAEVFGAGHNALGAWLWLGERGELGTLEAPRTFQQQIGDEVLPIELQSVAGRVHGRMTQATLKLFEPLEDSTALTAALGLEEGELLNYPSIRPADTGVTHLMIRVKDVNAVDRAQPDANALLAELKRTPAEGAYIYSFDDAANPVTAYARFFNPTVGLWEDAATGTAAGPLAAYLASLDLLPSGSIEIEQGTKMGRRSLLQITLSSRPVLSGTGRIVLAGTLSI